MRNKQDNLWSVLKADTLDLKELKKICIDGCSDTPGIRSLCWKYLLDYLPSDRSKLDERLARHRREYTSYVRDFVVETGDTKSLDHPLSCEPNGDWINFFNDNEVLVQINKDCRRLCPDFDFFHRVTEFPSNTLFGDDLYVGILRRRIEASYLQSQAVQPNLIGVTNMVHMSVYDPFQPSHSLASGLVETPVTPPLRDKAWYDSNTAATPLGAEQHWEVIERILYVYYKTHTAQGYVQGMNEVIAPIYYVFATDPDEQWRRYAEADTFYCFNNLMTEIHTNFIRKLDNGQFPGIGGQIRLFMDYLSCFDKALFTHLSGIGLAPEHYAFRWLSLLLAREFRLPDVIHIWDTLFADEHRFALLPFVACAMLILIREPLLNADFPTAVNLVQHYPSTVPIFAILSKARELYSTCYHL
ncbi:TBC1 domain member 13 [Clonorchis sinensis]|uniref:TBC1 domain member 13 n=1 Tax=Clonorchis sinensis TaxID=79923 RepID=A0A8T1MDL5_CLOSI|nr:TBC1 domain member 13 [Clonorchis sinensis]